MVDIDSGCGVHLASLSRLGEHSIYLLGIAKETILKVIDVRHFSSTTIRESPETRPSRPIP